MDYSEVLGFWGKSRQAFPEAKPVCHPLVYHSLDVAAVADQLLTAFPRRLRSLAGLCSAEPEAMRALLVRLIALHDIGKFHPVFQAKLPELCPPGLLKHGAVGPSRHDLLGFVMMEEYRVFEDFAAYLPGWHENYDFKPLYAAIAFHHGGASDASADGSYKGIDAVKPACDFYRHELCALLPLAGVVPQPGEKALAVLTWAVAGLTVLADWIGSNARYFEYPRPAMTLADYWQHAQTRAGKAVRAAGILPAQPRTLRSAAHFLPEREGKKPAASPLQEAAFKTPLEEGPQLFIIEDVTGAGKTEAALILASRLLSENRASGLFFALPTMATANAMYERMAGACERIFEPESRPSLVLAHGRKALHEGFVNSVLDIDDDEASPRARTPAEETAEATCAAWIADDRRKAFFAHIGAGTIDQALLGVLPSRHQALRLWGLADRVLIIDEAHAYDTYVNKEMERLIEFHTALGGSTIVLSATLSTEGRRMLLDAFSRGAGGAARKAERGEYPLLTAIAKDGLREEPVLMRDGLGRSLPVRRLSDSEAALDEICAAAESGAAVAWIRNAVDDAIEACAELEKRGLQPLLLHARFAMGDRLRKERQVAQSLGRDSKPEQRRSFVVVGTQILEQSLDYDVDAMVTDLAPIDLMIQRAGRLWRHKREARPIPSRELMVLSPDPEHVQDANWYAGLLPRSAGVYCDPGLVWRSAKALCDAGSIDTPGNIRDLIAKVYDSTSMLETPSEFDRKAIQAEGKDSSKRSIASGNLLGLHKGYYGNNHVWSPDQKTPTRLEEDPSTTFRLGKLEGDKIVPWFGGEGLENDPKRAWALSEVSIASRRASGAAPLPALESRVQTAKLDWGKWERDMPLLVLEPGNGGVWRGRVQSKDGEREALYDTRLGFRLPAG